MEKPKIFKNRKSQILILISFFIMAILILLIVAVLAPFGVLITTEFYEAGENIYLRVNDTLEINNTEVNARVQSSINSGFDALETNIDINTDLFQYGWIIVLVLVALSLFIYVLRIKQIQAGGGAYV